jgi:threonine dehydratase
VVLVLASYTMRSGTHEAALEAMLQDVDQAIIFIPPGGKALAESVAAWANASAQVTAISSVEGVCAQIAEASALANQIVIMSNQAVADLLEALCVALDLE